MSKYTVTKPVKVILNNKQYLLEEGDEITVNPDNEAVLKTTDKYRKIIRELSIELGKASPERREEIFVILTDLLNDTKKSNANSN